MRTLMVFLIIVALFAAAAVYAAQAMSGVWTAQIETDRLQVTLMRSVDAGRHGMSMQGLAVSMASLGSVTATAVTSPSADVRFSLDRAAGSFDFEGHFAGGAGAGHFRFKPREEFVRDMEVLGYRGFRDEDLLLYAVTDFSPRAVRELREMGYRPSRRELDDIAIFRITPQFAREMNAIGFGKLTLRDLNDLRISGINPKSIEDYRSVGYENLTLRELKDFGLHSVTPGYINDLRSLGYDDIRASQLIEMRIFDVTPEFIRKLEARGYRGVPVKKLITIRMAGADEIFTSP